MTGVLDVAAFCIDEYEKLYGFGKRLIIWTQGCSLRCEGCVNSQIWQFGVGTPMTIEEFSALLKDDTIEGVTLLGGEPLDQAEILLRYVTAAKAMGKTVVLFSGYRKSELKTAAARKIWRLSDLTVSGRYVSTRRSDCLALRGSYNQRLTYKGVYKNRRLKDDSSTEILIEIEEDGELTGRGFMNPEIDKLLNKLKPR